jgi:predicted nuclease of predicted toxin-antitoxin system
VAKILEEHKCEVIRLREKTAPDSPDTLVAAVSEANNAILVSMDGDFKSIAARNGIGQRRYRRLSLLRFERCRESKAAQRLASAISLIMHEWNIGAGPESKDRRMFVVITADTIRTHR